MKTILKNLIERIFPGTYDEYNESKEIHKAEIKSYRKNPQYILGLILFAVPALYLAIWKQWWIALPIVIGEMLIRDTISEHYCALLNRKQKSSNHR